MPTVQEAVSVLLNVCDGASTQDRRGFNRWDSQIVRSLKKSQWTPQQLRLAWRILRKYKKQLAKYDIDYDAISEPQVGEKPQRNRLMYIKEGKIAIRFDYDALLVDKIKDLPYQVRKYDPVNREWSLQANIDTVEKIWDLAIYGGFSLTEEVEEALENVVKIFIGSIEASKAESAELEIPGLLRIPYPYQKAGVKYMIEKKKVINGADMGLGKTGQTIMALEYTQAYPALIICPASVKYNWQKEVGLWIEGRTVEVLNGKSANYNTDITIVNYDILSKHIDKIKEKRIKAIVVDEFHKIKSAKAQRSQLVKKLAENAEYCFLLSGTPIPNRYKELIFPLQIIDKIDDFGGTWQFLTRFCGAYRNRFGLQADRSLEGDVLNAKLRASCMWRVMKTEVLKELPPKRHFSLEFHLSNEKEYRKAEENLAQFLANKAIKDQEFLDSISHLSEEQKGKAITLRATSIEEKVARAEQLVQFTTLRKLAAVGILLSVKEWITDHFEENKTKLVIGAWHQEIIDEINQSLGGKIPHITGEVDAKKRQEYVDRFQNDPDCQFIICNLQAGGVGITLTAASNMIVIELPWTPGDLEQFEDRIFRIGQNADSVNIYKVTTPNTVYEDMEILLDQKRQVTNQATSTSVPFLENFTKRLQKRKG